MTRQAIIPVNKVKNGTVLVCDGGFTCMYEGAERIVHRGSKGLFVWCGDGKHMLEGQKDDSGENYVGFFLKEDSDGSNPA